MVVRRDSEQSRGISKSGLGLGLVMLVAASAAACDSDAPKQVPQPAKAATSASAATPMVRGSAAEPADKPPVVDRALLSQFGTLPKVFEHKDFPITKERVELGKALYFDKRFSKNQDISCNSCHILGADGADNQIRSPGHRKQLGGRNSPTVFNAAGHFLQFWDGRANTVEDQALGPIVNPVEMAMTNVDAVVTNIKAIPGYAPLFKAAFPGEAQPITIKNFGIAIGAFERTLVTPSPFDDYLAGEEGALTDKQKAGLALFLDVGCPTCHSGNLLGGREFKKLGQAIAWPDAKDLGRFDHTKKDEDKQFFKVQSLRNVARTAPYFHDGSVGTLTEAVSLMAKHQLGKTLTQAQAVSIAAFLESLNGRIPVEWSQEPEVLPAGPGLVKADPG